MIIGLTGGIGSGKTAVSDLFASKGITVVDADLVSRQVVEPNSPALNAITAHFGDDILDNAGHLNRRALRTKVFDNELERQWLEKLLHPLIAQEILRQLQASTSPYTLLVSPLLFEAGQVNMVNRTLVVDAPVFTQINRTIARDDTDEKGVKAIIATQMNRETRLSKADDVIQNDSDLIHLANEVSRLHELYLKLSANG